MGLFDDHSDRTQEPTLRRRTEARQRGQVARSADLSAALLLAGGLGLFAAFVPSLVGGVKRLMAQSLGDSSVRAASGLLPADGLGGVIVPAACLAGGLVLLAVLVNVVQVGFVASAEPLKPKWERVSVTAGVGRVFSVRTLVRGLMVLAKLAAIGGVTYVTIRGWLGELTEAAGWSVREIAIEGGRLALRLGFRLAAVLVVLGVADYLYQRWQHNEDLKMTRAQVREEQRSHQADPQLVSRRRRMMAGNQTETGRNDG